MIDLGWMSAQNTQRVAQHGSGWECPSSNKFFLHWGPGESGGYFKRKMISSFEIQGKFPQPLDCYWLSPLLAFANTSKILGLEISHKKCSVLKYIYTLNPTTIVVVVDGCSFIFLSSNLEGWGEKYIDGDHNYLDLPNWDTKCTWA